MSFTEIGIYCDNGQGIANQVTTIPWCVHLRESTSEVKSYAHGGKRNTEQNACEYSFSGLCRQPGVSLAFLQCFLAPSQRSPMNTKQR